MVPRVSMMPVLPRVSTMLDRVLGEMDGRCWPLFFTPPLSGGIGSRQQKQFSLRRAFNNPPKRHGVENVGGAAGVDDV